MFDPIFFRGSSVPSNLHIKRAVSCFVSSLFFFMLTHETVAQTFVEFASALLLLCIFLDVYFLHRE